MIQQHEKTVLKSEKDLPAKNSSPYFLFRTVRPYTRFVSTLSFVVMD